MGLAAKQVEFAVRKYKKHRGLPPEALDNLKLD
jgi:hypothetical protein